MAVRVLGHAMVESVQRGLSTRRSDARPQPGEYVEPGLAVGAQPIDREDLRLEHGGQPRIRLEPQHHAVELPVGHAYHGDFRVAGAQLLADGRGRAAEVFFPEAMADDGYGRSPGAVVGRREGAAKSD